MRRARVYFQDRFAGYLTDYDDRFEFVYDESYLEDGFALSVTLPLRKERNWKIDPNNRMSLLLLTGKDTVGAVSVVGEDNE